MSASSAWNSKGRRPRIPEAIDAAGFYPNSEMEMAAIPRCVLVAVRYKAVLKHAQSKSWCEVRCDPVNASGLRTIYRRCFPPPSHPIRRQYPLRGFANFGFRA